MFILNFLIASLPEKQKPCIWTQTRASLQLVWALWSDKKKLHLEAFVSSFSKLVVQNEKNLLWLLQTALLNQNIKKLPVRLNFALSACFAWLLSNFFTQKQMPSVWWWKHLEFLVGVGIQKGLLDARRKKLYCGVYTGCLDCCCLEVSSVQIC